MITFNDVTFRYPYDDFDVLKDASFTLHEGVNTPFVRRAKRQNDGSAGCLRACSFPFRGK